MKNLTIIIFCLLLISCSQNNNKIKTGLNNKNELVPVIMDTNKFEDFKPLDTNNYILTNGAYLSKEYSITISVKD